MNHVTPDTILATPVSELANQPSDSLFRLKNDAADYLAIAKSIAEHIDRALDLKYVDRTRQLRLAQGKDTGVVHFDDGEVSVTADLPKKVEWDQATVARLVANIVACGDDPSQYVEISYRISETKFNAWPHSLRKPFSAARTVKVGKPSYRLALLSKEGE